MPISIVVSELTLCLCRRFAPGLILCCQCSRILYICPSIRLMVSVVELAMSVLLLLNDSRSLHSSCELTRRRVTSQTCSSSLSSWKHMDPVGSLWTIQLCRTRTVLLAQAAAVPFEAYSPCKGLRNPLRPINRSHLAARQPAPTRRSLTGLLSPCSPSSQPGKAGPGGRQQDRMRPNGRSSGEGAGQKRVRTSGPLAGKRSGHVSSEQVCSLQHPLRSDSKQPCSSCKTGIDPTRDAF
jgi:hypothetical protein